MAADASPRAQSPDVARRFPLLGLLDALDAWLRLPDSERQDQLVTAVRSLVAATGARGAYLEIGAHPLTPFTAGYGSLEQRPGDDAPVGVRSYDLMTTVGGASLGRVWIDAGSDEAALIVRMVELTLAGAWSRAEVARANARLSALDEATRAISAELDPNRVLQLIVDRVRSLVGARYAALGIVDARGRIERFITSGISEELRGRIGPPPQGHGLLGKIIRDGVSLRIADIAAHPDAAGFPPEHPVMHSLLGVPVRIGTGAIGNFYLADKQGGAEFTAADQDLVEAFALHAGIAIHNARLHQQVQEFAIVDERLRISRDLHDGIIQAIYAVALSLEDVPELVDEDRGEAIERVDRAIDRLNTTITDIRTFIVGLGPSGGSIVDALGAVATEITAGHRLDLRVDFSAADGVEGRLSPQATHELVQIAREALSNVARHSDAERAELTLVAADGVAVLAVSDDGRGFDVGQRAGAGHFGLANLHDRAVAVGGELEIDSEPGRGTRIIVRLPLTNSGSPTQ